jgi:hypothetical protein
LLQQLFSLDEFDSISKQEEAGLMIRQKKLLPAFAELDELKS